MLHRFRDVFSLTFHHLCKQTSLRYQTSRNLVLKSSMMFLCSKSSFAPFYKNMNLHYSHAPFCYKFWDFILRSFGIDFGSILEAFCYNFLYFSVRDVSMNFRCRFSWVLDQNCSQRRRWEGITNRSPSSVSASPPPWLPGSWKWCRFCNLGSQKGTAVTQKTWITNCGNMSWHRLSRREPPYVGIWKPLSGP